MPYRELIIFSYFVQGSHAVLSAIHVYLIEPADLGSFLFNLMFAGFNCAAFLSAADWRAKLRAHRTYRQRQRDIFRR